jgi:hypothetical protein
MSLQILTPTVNYDCATPVSIKKDDIALRFRHCCLVPKYSMVFELLLFYLGLGRSRYIPPYRDNALLILSIHNVIASRSQSIEGFSGRIVRRVNDPRFDVFES